MHLKMSSTKWRLLFNVLIKTLRLRQNGSHFPDDIFKYIFLNANVWITIKISLKFVPKGSIDNIPALVQIMAWHRPGYKPLNHWWVIYWRICVTLPQWVNKPATVSCHYNMVQNMSVHWSRTYRSHLTFTKKHPISCPHRRAMVCLLWVFVRKLAALLWCCTVYSIVLTSGKHQASNSASSQDCFHGVFPQF